MPVSTDGAPLQRPTGTTDFPFSAYHALALRISPKGGLPITLRPEQATKKVIPAWKQSDARSPHFRVTLRQLFPLIMSPRRLRENTSSPGRHPKATWDRFRLPRTRPSARPNRFDEDDHAGGFRRPRVRTVVSGADASAIRLARSSRHRRCSGLPRDVHCDRFRRFRRSCGNRSGCWGCTAKGITTCTFPATQEARETEARAQ